MKKILYAFLLLSLLTSSFAHAGLTSLCDPQQDLGTYVSYIDKITNENSSAGAGVNPFFYNVKTTLKEGQSGYLDMFKPSHFRYEIICEGPCTFESESVFLKLQRGIKYKANDIYQDTRKYFATADSGRSNDELFLGLRNDVKFDGFYNGKKIPSSFNSAIDDLLKEAKASKTLVTKEKLESIPGYSDFFKNVYDFDQKKTIVDALKLNPRKTIILNFIPYDKAGKVLIGHSVNVISEGVMPTSKVIFVSNGRISRTIDLKDLTNESFREAIIETHTDSKQINDFYFSMFWE